MGDLGNLGLGLRGNGVGNEGKAMGEPHMLSIDPTEFYFKLVLVNRKYDKVGRSGKSGIGSRGKWGWEWWIKIGTASPTC